MIKTVSLTKTFGPTTALENLSTTIESGSIYGLVGSNGAGKSTPAAPAGRHLPSHQRQH